MQYPLYLGVASYRHWMKCGCLFKEQSANGYPGIEHHNHRSCLPVL
ncbi:hypothetical protein CGCSCA1_v002260 [Colletotrichum siamense]|nr:hypothetical protein CGCSCA1_v002260 [Colletotrichum siamense]